MRNKHEKASDLNKLHEIEKACSFKIIDARDAAISYLRAVVRLMPFASAKPLRSLRLCVSLSS